MKGFVFGAIYCMRMTIWKINQLCWYDIIQQDLLVTSAKGGGASTGFRRVETDDSVHLIDGIDNEGSRLSKCIREIKHLPFALIKVAVRFSLTAEGRLLMTC